MVTHQPSSAKRNRFLRVSARFTVKFTDARRKSETKQFWEVEKSRGNAIASAEVRGPWGARRVVCELPPTPKNGQRSGNYGNYTVTAFYKGGWYFSRGGTDNVPGGPITVRVD